MFAYVHEDTFDIARDCRRRWYVVVGTSRFHQRLKAPVADNIERTLVLTNPTNYLGPANDNSIHPSANDIGCVPCFGGCVLPVLVLNFALPSPLECSLDRFWVQKPFDGCVSHLICVAGLVRRLDDLLTPASLSVLPQVARRLRIAFVKKSADASGLVPAIRRSAHKGVV